MPYTVHSMCGVGLIAPLLLAFMIFSLNSGIPIIFARWHCFMTCFSPLCPFLCSRLLKLWLFVGRASFAFVGADG